MLPDTMYDNRPEQPQAIEIDRCSQCGNGILQGEEYYDFGGEVVCNECLDEYLSYFKKGN